MSDPFADRTGYERPDSAEVRRPGEPNHVRTAVQELETSLEEGISRLNVRLAILIPILIPCAVVVAGLVMWLLSALEAPVWVAVPGFMIALFLPPFLAAKVPELVLVRRASRLIAQRFPEGSRQRDAAIDMLSKIKTRHKVRQRLLRALGAPEELVERPPTPPSVFGRGSWARLASAGVGLTVLVAAVIGAVWWEEVARTLSIDDMTRAIVGGAVVGLGLGAIFVCLDWRGPKRALAYTVAMAIGSGSFSMISWARVNYGWRGEIAVLVGVVGGVTGTILLMYVSRREPN